MIGLSFFILSFLCTQLLDAAEVSTSTQPRGWEQPVIGTQAEFDVIHKFNKVLLLTSNNDSFVHLMEMPCKSIIKENIKEHIEMHVNIIKSYNSDNKIILPKLVPQSFLERYWWKEPEQYENCFIPIQISVGMDKNKGYDRAYTSEEYTAGILSRAKLYAQLYNKISQSDKKEKPQLSALHVELLFDVCKEICVEIKAGKHKKIGNKRASLDDFLKCRDYWLSDKERKLINGDAGEVSIVSTAGSYDIVDKENTRASFPPYCVDEKGTVSGARQIVQEKLSEDAGSGYRLHFYDQLNGYHAFRDGDHAFCDYWLPGVVPFLKASWIDQDVCLIYERIVDDSAIKRVTLPSLAEANYFVQLQDRPNESCLATEAKIEELCVRSKKITAFAYDKDTQTILYTDGEATVLKGVKKDRVNSDYKNNLRTIISGRAIKKILAVAGGVYIVVDEDGAIYYCACYENGSYDIKPLELGFGRILDVAFDANSQQLAFLTFSGVYTVSCCPIKEEKEGSEKLKRFRSALDHAPRALSKWNIGSDVALVKNQQYDYAQHWYDTIDFHNGQIYAIREPMKKDQGHVLVYPPLSTTTREADSTNDITKQPVPAVPVEVSSSSSSSSSSSDMSNAAKEGGDIEIDLSSSS